MQIKLRNAIGALKDQTSISLAKVSSTGIPDLDVAILKATSHEEVPMEEKYVQEVLHLTSYSPPCPILQCTPDKHSNTPFTLASPRTLFASAFISVSYLHHLHLMHMSPNNITIQHGD